MNKKKLSLLLLVSGAVLAGYSIAAIAFMRQSGDVPGVSWIVQTGACLSAGIALSLWGGSLRTVSDPPRVAWGTKRPYKPPERESSGKRAAEADLFDRKLIDLEEQKDLSALHHLAERVRDNHEALALCKQLQDCIFELHHGALDDGDASKKTFTSSVEVQGGTTTIKRESVAENSDPSGVDTGQGAFFL